MVAEDKSSQEKVWEPRKNIGDALKESGSVIIRDDLVVPPSEIPALLERLMAIEERRGVEIHCFGHVGDGNIHVDIDGEATDEERDALISDLYRATLDLGGSITAEHGIGYVKKRWLGLGLDPTQVELMKKIKSSFDPRNILNPGKMFDA
jgi:glycolate oxidase